VVKFLLKLRSQFYKNSIFEEVKLCIGLEILVNPSNCADLEYFKKWYESENIHKRY